jgi:RimK family alpha-L-glutamate ligase
MRIGILAQPDSFYFRDVARAAAGDEVIALSFNNLRSEIEGGAARVFAGDINLANFDAIIVRTMPPGSLEQVVLRMDLLAILESRGTLVVNPPKSLEAAVDKYLTSARLALAGIPTPRTIACQTWESALKAFETLGGKAVAKPLFGGEGRGISLISDAEMAHRAFKLLNQLGAVIYLQEYIDHGGADLRILLIGDAHFAVKRANPTDWRTNASRGAITTRDHPTAQQLDLARRAAKVIGAPIAGVDLVTDRDGKDYVIEVNAVPGWKATAKALEVDIAARVIVWIRSAMR